MPVNATDTAVTVKTNGQTLVVSIPCVAYTEAAMTNAVTFPNTITSDTTYYIPKHQSGSYAISVKQLDGTELYGKVEALYSGLQVIAPLPSAAQVASDVGRRDLSMAPTGARAETYSRAGTTTTNGSPLSTGRLTLVAIHLPASTVVTSITFVSQTTAASVPLNQWFALYDSSRALLRQTTDDTTTAWGSTTAKTLNLTSTFTTTYSGLHYLGICVVATTPPTLVSAGVNTTVNNLPPITTGSSTSSLTDTAPATAAALTVNSNYPYAYVS